MHCQLQRSLRLWHTLGFLPNARIIQAMALLPNCAAGHAATTANGAAGPSPISGGLTSWIAGTLGTDKLSQVAASANVSEYGRFENAVKPAC